MRRSVQLMHVRPDLETCSIRGNVDTRLRKFTNGDVDGIIVAAAALIRLGWQDKITEYLPTGSFLPSAGQGALVIEARIDDKEVSDIVAPLNHLPTWQCVMAERAFLRAIGVGCRAPVAALGRANSNALELEVMITDPDGKTTLQISDSAEASSFEELGLRLAYKMLDLGASELIGGRIKEGKKAESIWSVQVPATQG